VLCKGKLSSRISDKVLFSGATLEMPITLPADHDPDQESHRPSARRTVLNAVLAEESIARR